MEIAKSDEIQDIHELQEDQWEERTLNLLADSKIDQEFSAAKSQKRGRRKHSLKWMRTPMAIPEVILELQEEKLRETALRCLSTFLIERREEDPENYYRTGFLLYHSCGTMAILVQVSAKTSFTHHVCILFIRKPKKEIREVVCSLKQEMVAFFQKMTDGSLNIRSSKRLANVITLLQSIAANHETRWKLVKSRVPNFLVPLILFQSPLETRDRKVIKWAIESNMVGICQISIKNGNELSKVIGMHILEAILQDWSGICYICSPRNNHLLGLMETWDNLVALLAVYQDFSPRLLFHIIRCYVLLCNHMRGFNIVMAKLPKPLLDGSFQDMLEEFPVIRSLLHHLLLTIGNAENCFLTTP
ncbi:PREDICTED: cell differentiation protein RCD1 homolog isoform X2 [Nelumbo nucifera]|uniref:Cell differentiation protein RCD1 homolog isoform X2 n=1 Tax=Nelumbo nucifera TaxID=4432 RepID=A0A1U8Q783_NELNU|nr:PREDICTED: cell differentiation protein RCD1 homolog isoform X2 [Nelumbo nucifera]